MGFWKSFRDCLAVYFKQQFSVFKQHYTYFHTFFHLYIFSKNTNNVTRTTLPNRPLICNRCFLFIFKRLILRENMGGGTKSLYFYKLKNQKIIADRRDVNGSQCNKKRLILSSCGLENLYVFIDVNLKYDNISVSLSLHKPH